MTEKASRSKINQDFSVKKTRNPSKIVRFCSNDLRYLRQQDGGVGAAVDIQLF